MKFTFIVTPDRNARQKFLLRLYDRLAARRHTELNLLADVPPRAATTAPVVETPFIGPAEISESNGRHRLWGDGGAKPLTDSGGDAVRDGNLWLRRERKILAVPGKLCRLG